MTQENRLKTIIGYVAFIILIPCFLKCSNNTNAIFSKFSDSTVLVYGPYRALKLPITKGVNILNPMHVSKGPGGKIYSANQGGQVYSLEDSDGDGIEDSSALFCDVTSFGLRNPAGFAHRGDTIYIGTSEEIRAFIDKNKDGKADTSWTFFNDIPHSKHPYEWTNAFAFGPDGWMYFVLTTDSWNAGASPDPKQYRGAILRISPDGKKVEKIATGIRSVYGMGFNQYGDLFFADNEGGGNQREELNRFIKGRFYGHNPKKYIGYDSVTGPEHVLNTEVAPSQIVFNSADNDFGGTAGNLFVAYYGPAERWNRGGVGRIEIDRQADGTYKYIESPLADVPKLSGITFGKDGSLYLSNHGMADYWYNSIEKSSGGFYKVISDPSLKNQPVKSRVIKKDSLSQNSIEIGKRLFTERACFACHATDGNTDLLGPNLLGLGNKLSREDILTEIKNPSQILKSSMVALRVYKKDGHILLGRVIQADEKQISLMLVGNMIVEIPRTDIMKTEDEMKSLMYENLLKGLTTEQINSLLDYLVSLK